MSETARFRSACTHLDSPPSGKVYRELWITFAYSNADDTKQFLDPIAKRIEQVLLYFNYKELCKHPEESCPPSTSKQNATRVLNRILDAYPDDPRISMSRQSRCNKISGYHVRRGRWWWKLAGTLGVGILLISDSSLISTMCVSQLAHCVAQLTQLSR